MSLKHVVRVSSIAAGIGVAGVFGTTVATANAAPAACTSSPQQACSVISKASGSGVNLNHHQRKQVDKLVKEAAKGH
jgi:hypothetical protein